jgi:restriction system protein
MEWDDGTNPPDATEIAIGWPALGDLSTLASSRDAFKAAYSKAYPTEKPGAVPVRAGVLFRFAKEMRIGDVMVYPSRFDKMVNIGLVASDYSFSPSKNPEYPHRRIVNWKAHLPRPQFSKPALDEIGSAITLFQISNNTDEFVAALEGTPFNAADVDAVTAVDTAAQAQESVEDFVIKRVKNGMSDGTSLSTSSPSSCAPWATTLASRPIRAMAVLIFWPTETNWASRGSSRFNASIPWCRSAGHKFSSFWGR